MKRLWMGCLGLALGLTAQRVQAQELQWRPVNTQTAVPAASSIGVTLRPPEALPTTASDSSPLTQTSASNQDDIPAFRVVRAQGGDSFGGPAPVGPVPPPPPFVAGPTEGPNDEKFNCAVKVKSSDAPSIWDQTRDGVSGIPKAFGEMFSGGGRNLFQSDHSFDVLSSPVSNPFYSQDPRSLTEIKPLFIYEHLRSSNNALEGGDIWFYGLQGRLAITDFFSVVLDKLGAVTVDPHNSLLGSHTGFAEISLGPQFTFYRCEQTKTVLAAGLLFDIAAGSGSVYQDTGDLSVIPYFSAGQNFFKTSYGSVNFLNTTGYSISVDSARTDFFYSSFHFDYDVGNLNKIFPLIELNWFHYTSNGHSNQFFGFEGGDLINFGSGGVAGENQVSMALGLRYKFAEWLQTGLVFEFPLVNDHDIMSYRVGFDLIFRY